VDLFKPDAEKLAEFEKLKLKGLDPQLLAEHQAKQKAAAQQVEYPQFAQATDRSAAPPSSISGQVNTQTEALATLRQDTAHAMGVTKLPDEMTNEKLAEHLKGLPAGDAERKKALADFQSKLGGSGAIDGRAMQAVIDASSSIQGAVGELVLQTARRYVELIQKKEKAPLSEGDQKELDALEAQRNSSDTFRAILDGHTSTLTAKEKLDSLQERSARGAAATGSVEGAKPVDPYLLASSNVRDSAANIDKMSDPYKKKLAQDALTNNIKDGMSAHGVDFGSHVAATLQGSDRLGSFTDEELKKGIEEIVGTLDKFGPLIKTESSGNPDAVSPTGAKGIVQLGKEHWDSTKHIYGNLSALPKDSTPEQEIEHAKAYIFEMAKRHPEASIAKVLSAYNGGPTAEFKAGSEVLHPGYAAIVGKGSSLQASKIPLSQETKLQAFDTIAEENLRVAKTQSQELKALQDKAGEQAKHLSTSDEGKKPVTFASQTGKAITASPLELADGLNKEASKTLTSLSEYQDKLTTYLGEKDPSKKQALFTSLTPSMERQGGLKDLVDKGYLQVNPETQVLEQDPKNRAVRLSDKERSKLAEVKPKQEIIENADLANKISVLETEIAHLELTNKSALIVKDTTGNTPYDQLHGLQTSQLADKRSQIEANNYSEEELGKGVREKDLANQYAAELALKVKQTHENEKITFDTDKAILTAKKATLEAQIAVLEGLRTTLASIGQLDKFPQADLTSLQDQHKAIISSKLDLQNTAGESVTKDQVDAINAKQDLKNTNSANQATSESFSVRQHQISSGLGFYSPEQLAQNAYHQSIGQTQGIANQEAFAQHQVAGQSKLTADIGAELKSSLDELASHTDKSGLAVKGSEIAFDTLTKKTQGLQVQFNDSTISLAEAKARLESYNPTVSGELSQVSSTSIGAKLADLPSSLKNLNTNIENRAVTAVDQATTGLAESAISAAKSLLGLQKIPEMLLQTWSSLQVAQGNKAQTVAQGSVNLASQINSIRNNETDPVRQEMLIQRAQAAQSQSEAIAQNQVDQANNAYKKAQYDQSFAGKAGGAATDFITGAATDYLKGSVTQGIADMFRGDPKAGINSDGRILKTATGAQVVNVENFPGGVPGVGAPNGGLPAGSSILGDPLVPFATIPTTSGTPADSQTGDPSTKTADKIASSIDSSLSAPWYSGFTDKMSSGFSSLVGGLNNSFSTFTGALGVAMGLSNLHATDTLGEVQKYLGLAISVTSLGAAASSAWSKFSAPPAGSVIPQTVALNNPSMLDLKPLATGGSVFGAGTGTSDSIPTMLSHGEYVINAKTASAIGHDTLDAWNFASARPGRFATGGSIGNLATSVSNIAAPASATSAAPAAATPQSVRVVLVDDQRNVKNYLTSSEGEKVLVDFVKRNSLSLKSVLR